MYIHFFAGCYGIFASWVYSHKSNSKDNPNNKGSYGSMTLSFIGTFFLWVYFLSFNQVNVLHKSTNNI